MNSKMDPMGRTIADYWKTKKADRLRVFSPIFEEDEIPLSTLFRKYKAMPKIERKASSAWQRPASMEVLPSLVSRATSG